MISVVYNSGQQATTPPIAMNRSPKQLTRQQRRKAERSRGSRQPSTRGRIRNHQPLSPVGWFWIAVFSGILLMAGYWLVTNQNQAAHSGGADSNAQNPELMLREMLAAYRNLNTYADQTTIRLEVPTEQGIVKESAKLQIAYARPNRLRIRVVRPDSNLKIDCAMNAQTTSVEIVDPTTNNFDGQFVVRATPTELTIADIYAATEYADVTAPNELFSLLTSLPAQLQVSQLAMLMNPSPLQPLIDGAQKRQVIEPQSLDGQPCNRVRLTGEQGAFIFWIDQAAKLLRRVEFPMGADKSQGSLVADYQNIKTSQPLSDDLFVLEQPQGKRLVRNFVLPPMDRPPTVLDKSVNRLEFQDPNHQSKTLSWNGHITLLCWFDRNPGSRAAMQKLALVHSNWPDKNPVKFVAVFAENSTAASNADLRQIVSDWGIPFPVVRDVYAHGRDVFEIEVTPSLIAVDSSGTVQLVEQGVDPQLSEQLPIVLDRLVQGDSLAKQYLEMVDQKRAAYDRAVMLAGVNAPANATLVKATLKPAAAPKHLNLKPIWKNSEFKRPGNLVTLVNADDSLTVLLSDDGNIFELSANGKNTGQRTTQGDTHQLATFVGANGKTIAGWSNLAKRVTVWNDEWKPLFQYPPTDDLPRIQAVHLADLDQNGQPELYVAFADGGSVHRVETLGPTAGEKSWANKPLTPVVAMTSSLDTTGTSFIMATGQGGLIHPIDAQGISQQEVKIESRAIHRLVSSDPQDPQSIFCGLSQLATDELMAIGLDGKLEEQWTYRLPSSDYRTQIDYVTTISLGNGPDTLHWVFAGSDGSIHVVSADGSFNDEFALGDEVTGIASYRTRAGTCLVVATDKAVRALRISK